MSHDWIIKISKLNDNKFHLQLEDINAREIWHKKAFSSNKEANDFAKKFTSNYFSYDSIANYGEDEDIDCLNEHFIVFDPLRMVIHEDWLIHWDWVDEQIELYDPWGESLILNNFKDRILDLDSVLKTAIPLIHETEVSRLPIHPFQLSLFELLEF
ncbi:MAG TPA: hypothetical protein VK184_09505 [Nostocaceae cyanobacterium]|nr:hypothetical protein [Nostocaceae cyanobacterium]